MTWLVDGMNVIGSRPTGWWRDRPKAMSDLVRRLEAFAPTIEEPLLVVFDGRPFDLDGEGVEVRFASRRGPNAADDDLAVLARKGDTVVTSDATLANRVRAKGADVVGAGAFQRTLDAV